MHRINNAPVVAGVCNRRWPLCIGRNPVCLKKFRVLFIELIWIAIETVLLIFERYSIKQKKKTNNFLPFSFQSSIVFQKCIQSTAQSKRFSLAKAFTKFYELNESLKWMCATKSFCKNLFSCLIWFDEQNERQIYWGRFSKKICWARLVCIWVQSA